MSNVLDVLEETVQLAVEYMKLPRVEALKGDYATFREHMREKFPVLWDNYPSIFEKLVKGDNMDMIYLFIAKLREVDSGSKTIDGVRNELAHQLHNQFVTKKQ